MKLYHASTNQYVAGQVIGPFETTHFIERKVKPNQMQHVEDRLESYRPETSKSRLRAVFAFDNPGHCIRFVKSEGHSNLFLYEVTMEQPSACPMCLVDLIRGQDLDQSRIREISEEYWSPKKEWGFLEYLDDRMTIVGTVDQFEHQVEYYAAGFTYGADQKQAQSILNEERA